MSEEAGRINLPLFTLTQDVPWVDLMAPLLERIINAEHSRLKQSMAIHRRFTELVLDGKGLDEIARTLSDLLGSAVVIEDATFHLLAYAGGSDVDKHRKETIARHGTPPRVLFDPGIQRMLREVAAHRAPREVPAAESSVRGEFLDDLAQGSYGDEAAAQRRARHLGYPMAGHHVLVVVDVDGFGAFAKSKQLTEEMIQSLKREFLRRVSGILRRSFPRALVGARSDSVLALLPLGAETEGHEGRVRALRPQAPHALAEWHPGFTVSVGFSAPTLAPAGISPPPPEVPSAMQTPTRLRPLAPNLSANEPGLTRLPSPL